MSYPILDKAVIRLLKDIGVTERYICSLQKREWRSIITGLYLGFLILKETRAPIVSSDEMWHVAEKLKDSYFKKILKKDWGPGFWDFDSPTVEQKVLDLENLVSYYELIPDLNSSSFQEELERFSWDHSIPPIIRLVACEVQGLPVLIFLKGIIPLLPFKISSMKIGLLEKTIRNSLEFIISYVLGSKNLKSFPVDCYEIMDIQKHHEDWERVRSIWNQ